MQLKGALVFRPLNLLILFLSQFLAFFFINNSVHFSKIFASDSLKFWLVSIGTCLIAAAGYLINDVFDEGLDHLNKPNKRPIQYWTRPKINITYALFNLIALLIGVYLGMAVFQVFLSCALILYLYSARLQKWVFVGNFAVAILAALSLILIKFIAPETNSYLLLFFAGFAFIMSMLRELAKDIEDMDGDEQMGYKTIPIVFGKENSKYALIGALSITVYLLYLGVSQWLIPYLMYPISARILTIYFGIFVLFPIILLFLLILNQKEPEWNLVSNILKYIMYTGTLSMLFF